MTAARTPTPGERRALARIVAERDRLNAQAAEFEALLRWVLLRSERQHHWAVNE